MEPLSAPPFSRPVSLAELLASRDSRQARQKEWRGRFGLPLVSFTALAPGAVKDSGLTRAIFNHGVRALEAFFTRQEGERQPGLGKQANSAEQTATPPPDAACADAATEPPALPPLAIYAAAQFALPSGAEALWAIDAEAASLKRTLIDLEDSAILGRLWDIDIIDRDGKILSRADYGLPPRRCLLCANPASVCARARVHSLTALQTYMEACLRHAESALQA